MQDTQSPDQHHEPRLTRPSVVQVLAQAREMFAKRRIKWAVHSDKERMPERGFDFFDVEAVVMKGFVPDGVVHAGRNENEWKIKIVDKLEGTSRKMGVVCVVAQQRFVIIVTTEWEDR